MSHALVMLERTEALMPVEQAPRLNPREEGGVNDRFLRAP